MTISTGSDIVASDYVSTSAGAGDSGKVPKLNASGKLDKTFLLRFGVKAKQATGTSIGTGMTVVNFDAEDFDDNTMHDNVTNNSRLTINTAGTWLIGGCVRSTAASTGVMGIKLRLNGSTIIASAAGTPANGDGGAYISVVRVFSASDYIEMLASLPSGASGSSGDEATNFWAILLQTT